MKESFWGYFVILLGLFVIIGMMLIKDVTSTSEEDYLLGKEAMDAAMYESIDLGLYRATGEIRIIKEKFVENFTRRFAESVKPRKEYQLDFYEIYEMPAKATVRIRTKSEEYEINSQDPVSINIDTVLSDIVETRFPESRYPYGCKDCSSFDPFR